MIPETRLPENRANLTRPVNDDRSTKKSVRGMSYPSGYMKDLVREFEGYDDEDSLEYVPDYKHPGYATEVAFEDVIPDYVTADDQAVAYPLAYFTSPKINTKPRLSQSEESRKLYDELRRVGQVRSRDVSFGEGITGQAIAYRGKRATVILPTTEPTVTKKVSMCRDRECNLIADPDANGFCLAHFKEIQATLAYQPRGAVIRTPSRGIPKPNIYSESPKRTTTSAERASSASRQIENQAHKRSYGTSPPGSSLTINDTNSKPQMKTQKTQTRNVSGQPKPTNKPTTTQNTTAHANSTNDITEEELEKDYEDMLNNILEVSKIATKKCRQPRCDNFGNEKCKGLCNGCYQKYLARKAEKQREEAERQQEAEKQRKAAEKQRQAVERQRQAEKAQTRQQKVSAGSDKPKIRSTTEYDIYRRQNREVHQCKVYGCRNYASKAGFCNESFNRQA